MTMLIGEEVTCSSSSNSSTEPSSGIVMIFDLEGVEDLVEEGKEDEDEG